MNRCPLAKDEAYISPLGGTKHHLGSNFERKKQSDSDQAFRSNQFTRHRAEEPVKQYHREGSSKLQTMRNSTGHTTI